jgi:hypothetical protein
MKYRAFLAATAMMSSSIVSPAYAAVTLIDSIPAADPPGLDVTNLALAQDQCDAAAAAADLDGPGEDTDIYTGVVVEGTVTLKSGPTEVGTEGDRDIDLSTRVGAGTFTPGYVHILGDPYRNGGSVNMFGMREAIGGHYSNSAYDFTADFKTTYTHPYTCDIYKAVYHPAVAPGPVQGYYTNPGEGDCNGIGPDNPHWGEDLGACHFNKTGDGTPGADEYHDPVANIGNVAGGSFDQDQTDNLNAHESMGAGFDTSEPLLLGQAVVCISPSKTGPKGAPGTWTKQNGYTGDKCTTVWYNGGATVGVPNLNDGSHNWVTVPVI